MKWILSVGLSVLFLGALVGWGVLCVVLPWVFPATLISFMVVMVSWWFHDCVLR